MSGGFHEGRFYESTDMVCRRCGHPVYESDIPGYSYQCFHCDEDLYSFEVTEQDGRYLPPVMVALPAGGGLEYLLDGGGEPCVFAGQPEAERFLLGNGLSEEELEMVYFVEVHDEG